MKNPANGWGPGQDYQSAGPIKTVAALHKLARALLATVHPGSKMAAAAESALRSPDYFMARPTLQAELVDMARRYPADRFRQKKNPGQKARAFIGKKIRRLAREGMRAPRRVAAAYALARRGGFRSVPKRARRNPALSESSMWRRVREIARKLAAKDFTLARELEDISWAALQQLRRGVHENPTLAVLGNPPRGVAGVLSKHTYGGSIRYRHSQDGKDYRHTLGSGAHILLLRDGSVLLQHPTKRLWEDM